MTFSIGGFLMKTTIGQIIAGVCCFIAIMCADVICIVKREGPLRFLVFINILMLLFILCLVTDIYFKRPDITLYLAIAALLFAFGFEIFELALRRKNNKR
jgi:hypothetical protein